MGPMRLSHQKPGIYQLTHLRKTAKWIRVKLSWPRTLRETTLFTLKDRKKKNDQKIWDKCQQDLNYKEKQASESDRPPYSFSWETKTVQSQYQNFLGQLATLLSDSIVSIPATEEAVENRIQEIGANEKSWKAEHSETKHSQRDKHKNFKKQEKDNMQQMLLNIQKNLQIATTQRLKKKVQKLQKQLSDLKLSNKNMETQLIRVNVLKDKTIENLRQSLANVETMKEKAVVKTENLKTTLDSAEQEARSDKEKTQQMLDAITSEPPTAKSTPEEISGQEQELSNFQETIMKMLGFDIKTADKEIINQLKLIIQVYEISNKSKIASDCETGKVN
uniref:coiled-coil domain-containing protein 170-like n=1 Tax=Callithrix jacchus TaxID=9483 RepID=UPI00159F6FE0|nr:coiled-coil domain-containing protein 170-like [Callithrix jacchus]